MPRGIPKNKQTSLAVSAPNLVPTQAITSLSWFEKLNDGEKAAVISETQFLAGALLQHGQSKLAVGEHLSKLRDVLEPHNLFGRYLKNFHFSKRTAYRYITGFKNAQKILPNSVLTAAMARGVNIVGDTDQKPLGIYTEAVAKLPPPKDATEVQANTWLDQIEQVKKEAKSQAGTVSVFAQIVPSDPQSLLKECYRFVSIRYKRLPNNSRTRAAWVKALVGMVMTELGVAGEQTFAPQAVPEEFRVQRGRPKMAASA